jgi:predicted TIM-barrel fold metal-dependent hydrolase
MQVSTEPELDWMISVDDHVLEPKELWQSRLPRRYLEVGPRIVEDERGEAWVYEGKRIETTGLSAVAGKTRKEFSPKNVSYAEMRPGCYDSVERIKDLDEAGIIASLCFPSFSRFCGQTFLEGHDKELALLCVRAYNDWMIEEWCGSAPGRFIPLVLIPLWAPALAAAELERCAALGARAFCFSENPAPLGLPTIHDPDRYWDPVFSVANDVGMVTCIHIGSSSQIPFISPDSPYLANMSWGSIRPAGAMLAWLFSGHFERMPNLKIALSEGEIGWIPFFLERAQFKIMPNEAAMARQLGMTVSLVDASVSLTNPDYTALALEIKRSGANALESCLSATDNVGLMEALHNEGDTPKVTVLQTGYDQGFVTKSSEAALQGAYIEFDFTPWSVVDPGTKQMAVAFKKYAPVVFPGENSYFTYGGVELLAAGLRGAGANPTPASLQKSLFALKSYNGDGLWANAVSYAADFSRDFTNCVYMIQVSGLGYQVGHPAPFCGKSVNIEG